MQFQYILYIHPSASLFFAIFPNRMLKFDNSFIYSCHECAFPLCSDKCNDRDHTPIECKFFKDHSLGKYLHLKPVNKIELQHDFETIIILRFDYF